MLEYAQTVWSSYFVKDIEVLERVQRRVTRIPLELRGLPYEERLYQLNLTSLRERRQRGDLIQTYKIISNYYSVDLNFYQNSDNTNLRGHTKKIGKERCSKLARTNFFSNRVAYTWNALSQETVSAPSVNSFKNRNDTNLLNLNNELVHYGI